MCQPLLAGHKWPTNGGHLFSTIRLERSFFLIRVLKADNEARVPSFLNSLDDKSGPMFLIECLPYFTVSIEPRDKKSLNFVVYN